MRGVVLALGLGLALLAAAEVVVGDACLPLDVVTLLRGETCSNVASACSDLLNPSSSSDQCSQACFEAVLKVQTHRCYASLTQPQQLQPRFRSSSRVALQGMWYGLYPASGVDLMEVKWDAASGTLRGTKLTGNQFVRAGRVSWEATATTCKVASSVWAGAYTPRWDPCKFQQIDADHFDVALPLDDGGDEVIKFARALLPTLLAWEAPASPTFGFDFIFERCGLEAEELAASWTSSFWRGLHHSRNTVVLDQALLLFPLLLLGGWQMGSARSGVVLVPLVLGYCALLCARLQYLGFL